MLGLGMSAGKRAGKKKPANLHQEWDGYPQSPVLTADWPYQTITADYGYVFLICSKGKLYKAGEYTENAGTTALSIYNKIGSAWVGYGTQHLIDSTSYVAANSDVFTSSALTTVLFQKTTA